MAGLFRAPDGRDCQGKYRIRVDYVITAVKIGSSFIRFRDVMQSKPMKSNDFADIPRQILRPNGGREGGADGLSQ